ncbi:hypothetical protein MAFF211479_13970 [Ralstonia solanacearum]|nr:hypothetical protein MAFF211479_13970 [Ralstonia solanacearum]BCL97981.1 hypothetical protein MAFF211491_24330 [Ralstonia solanacearum]BCM13423.1 hypothetical protein MAFF241648_26130 [Ralstonia solanacearum]BCN04260.1 hypothetical protein RPSB_13970 [Ralstonia solanacearum]BCN10526.1 hypothetical protein RPSD_24110 [Ralstonia solanacearum]
MVCDVALSVRLHIDWSPLSKPLFLRRRVAPANGVTVCGCVEPFSPDAGAWLADAPATDFDLPIDMAALRSK